MNRLPAPAELAPPAVREPKRLVTAEELARLTAAQRRRLPAVLRVTRRAGRRPL